MSSAMSLRFQINVRIVLTSILILLIGGAVAIWHARGAVDREIDSSLNLTLQLVQLSFSQNKRSNFDVNEWLPGFVAMRQTRHLTIQLKKPSGEIVNFNSVQERRSDKEMPPRWFIKLVSSQYPEVEKQLTTLDGQSITLLIKANPLDEISEVWEESLAFFVSLVVMTLMTCLAVNLAFNKALKSIGVIVEGLKSIETGHYDQKLPEFSINEYDSIAGAINHMTEVLDAANKENSALTQHSLEIQEEERQNLSQELHDELGQSLTAIKVMAVTAKNKKAETDQIADTIISICDHLIAVVRSMMRSLHPISLKELGLKATLEDLLNQWAVRNPELKLTLECPDEVDNLDHKMTIQIFRVIQECLTNVVRHADASQAVIKLTLGHEPQQGPVLFLDITDDGKGCAPDSLKSGFGMLGMRERIKSLGGEFLIRTDSSKGLSVTASVPLR